MNYFLPGGNVLNNQRKKNNTYTHASESERAKQNRKYISGI